MFAAPARAQPEATLAPVLEQGPADAVAAQPVDPPRHPDSERSDPDTAERLRYVIDDVRITGNAKTRSRIISRFVPYAVGDILDVSDQNLELTRFRLLGTGYFRDVTLSLEKGSKRGHIILVVSVVERNTIVLNDLWMGLAASADTRGEERILGAFGGLDVAETNLLGSGISLGGATAFSKDQLALAARFLDPALGESPWMLSAELRYNDALGFFGNAAVRWEDPSQISEVPRQAVLRYRRLGSLLGVGRDLSVPTQFWLNYRLEVIHGSPPHAASHEYGGVREPIDFRLFPGRSRLAALQATIQHDTRDQPLLTNSGWLATLQAEVGLLPLGSNYDYQRVDASAARWWQLRDGHVLKLNAFAGLISGYAPFFEQYYVGDLSDFRPGRVLGLAFDDRPAPNFLDTSIAEIRTGDYAAKLGIEYRLAVFRGSRSIYGIDLFTSGGIWSLANARDFFRPPQDQPGVLRFPVDLTANIGVQMDTSLGGFSFSFANVLGFLPVRAQ
ncbi:MAG: hypothetical protein RJA70_2716 [Pseudomonadota bacterium]|jgi:outer membrane protein assembly factor BamA